MPLNDEHITWYLPALSERRIETDSSLFDFSTYIDPVADEITPSIELADLSALLKVSGDAYDEYIQPGYELDRTVINLWDWGHPDLEKAGAVEARVCFNETTSGAEWKTLLLFHEKAVVLEENSEPTIFDLCVKTTRCVISENARFVVAYEAVGNAYRGGDAVFLDTETGESIRFDPSPDRIYMDPYVVHSEVMISFGFRTIGHISNEGIFNRIDDYTYELQTFDNEMSIIRTISFEDIDFNPGEGDVISADGSRTLVIGEINDIRYMVFYDEAGIVYSIKPFPHGPVDISEKSVTTDREMSVVLITGSGETGWIDFPYSGTYLIDGITGEILQNWHENENTREPVISPNGEIAAHIVRFPETSYWRELLEIRDVSSGEIVFDYLREDEDVWSIRRVSELADNGNALIRLVKGGWARHALIDRNGSLLWASPVRTTRRSYVDLIHLSDDGYSLAFCDDYSLNIIRLKTESGI